MGKKISKPKKSILHDDMPLMTSHEPESWSRLPVDDSLTECQVLRPLTPERSDSSDEENMDDEFYLSDQEEYSGRKRERTPVKRVKQDLNPVSFGDHSISSFLDMTFWRRETICCGVIFKGPNNEVVISPKLLKPCSCRKSSSSGSTPKTPTGSTSDVSSAFSPPRLVEDDNESNASSYASVL
jgi:hypothetical protein